MPTDRGGVVLFGQESPFFEYAAYHLATVGLRTTAVVSWTALWAIVEAKDPAVVLLHWDSLGEGSLKAAAMLKSQDIRLVLILSEKLYKGPDVVAVLAAGADGLIEGALNPRILMPKMRAWLDGRSGVSKPGKSEEASKA